MILCLYMLWNDHSSKSGNSWSPHIVFLQWELLRFTFLSNFQICNTLLLTIVTMLYITSHDLFITGSCYLSTPFTHFNHSYPLLWQSPICSLCLQVWICLFCFVCLFVLILHINEIIQFLLFLLHLFHLAYVITNGTIPFFFMAKVVFHVYSYIYITLHHYPFIYWWTRRLLHISAIVNTAAVKTGVHISFQIRFFLTVKC